MKFKPNHKSSVLRFSMILSTAFGLGAGDALADATSTYMTVQPNGDNSAYVITMSWVAPDSNPSGDGSTYSKVAAFGNGAATINNPNNLQGGALMTGTGQSIRYRWTAVAPSSGSHIRYVTAPANTASIVQWSSSGDYNVGTVNPTTANAQWLRLGQWHSGDIWATNVQAYASDGGGMATGVSGVFSRNPNGAGAATGDGVGVYYDYESLTTGGIGFMLAGYDDLLAPSPVNPYPTSGYLRVEIPNPTTKWNDPGNEDFTIVPHTFSFSDKFNVGTFTDNAAVELVVSTDPNYTPKLAVSGDLDSDLDVDADDLAAAAAGFGGAGVTGKWYATGDMDADGDSDNADLGAVIGAFTPGSVSTTTADLIYNPTTGNVKLSAAEAAGAIITSFQLENSAGSFVDTNYSGPGGSFGGTYQDVTVNVIGDTDLTLAGFSGIVDLGNVLPTGLDAAGLEAYLTTAVYTGSAGTGQHEFDLVVDLGGGGDPPFTIWSNGAAANEDSNGDGIDNGIAWALGAAGPEEIALGLLPTLDNTSDPDFFIFTFNRGNEANDDPNTTINVEYGSDLSGWTTAVAGDDIVITETPGTPKDAVEVKIRRTLAVGDKLFVRLKVVVAP